MQEPIFNGSRGLLVKIWLGVPKVSCSNLTTDSNIKAYFVMEKILKWCLLHIFKALRPGNLVMSSTLVRGAS